MVSKRKMPQSPRSSAPGKPRGRPPGSKNLAPPRRRSNQPQSLASRTTPGDPEAGGHRGMTFLPQRSAGVVVNEDTALTQSTVWACIRVISESLAGMPWLVGRRLPDGTIDPVQRDDFDWLLNYQPNPETQSFAFRETLWAWALAWGNGYAEIERDLLGNPVNLWQLHPSRVRPLRNASGRLLYEVQNDSEPPSYLLPRDVFHLMGPSPDALVGWSVIRMHARTIGLAIAQEQNAASFNENDSTPGGLLEHPGKLSETARQNLEQSWNRRHRGPNNRRTVAILEEGMKWSQTGLPPNEAQLVEQMQLTPAMVCRIFGVPPHKVAASIPNASNMYSNVEQNEIAFAKDTLRPWAERGESEADIKLFGRNNQARLVTFIDLSERERGDTSSQTQHVKEMLFSGVYTINMALKYLGKSGIGPIGDQRYIQSSMIPLEDAGKQQPSPANEPEDSTEEPEVEPPSDDELTRERQVNLLASIFQRLQARQEANNHLDGEFRAAWLAKHRDYCREQLLPAARVISCRAADAVVDVAVDTFLAGYFAGESAETAEHRASQLRTMIVAAAAAKEAA